MHGLLVLLSTWCIVCIEGPNSLTFSVSHSIVTSQFFTAKDEGSTLAWWCLPIIPVIGRLRWEDEKFDASLDYIVSSRPTWAT